MTAQVYRVDFRSPAQRLCDQRAEIIESYAPHGEEFHIGLADYESFARWR